MSCKIYWTLLVTYSFVFGMLGVYSVAKRGMQADLHFSEDVFGNH